MLTDRFHQLRRKELDEIFSVKNISQIWRKIVRDQLRRVDVLDIYDYYDFNYNINARAKLVRSNLLTGNYEGSKPIIYRIEKKLGVCRHLVIPQPVDALVLQIITDAINEEVLDNQPSQNSFYSRDKHNLRKPHEIDEYGYNWRQLWKKMQKKIYKFNDDKELIVVTDLSNYYDSIYIPELRKIVSGHVKNNEVLLDILFKIIESVSWLPDYLPYVGRGLPTTNLEGVRLLAHSFLFELDSILKDKTNDSFTRWMDDIVVGVETRVEAIETLSSASDVLKSRGLALNLRKTNVYNAKEAEYHFLVEENRYLDSIDFDSHLKNGISKISSELGKRFNSHRKKNQSAKYFEKVSKRYITSFGRLKSSRILKDVPNLFNENPGIRQNLLFYLSVLGFNSRTSEVVLRVLQQLKLYDDISLFNVCKLITDWKVPCNDEGKEFVKHVQVEVTSFSKKRKNPFDFYCLLWLKTKYDHPEDLYNFLVRYEYIWKSESFLRRQATAVMGRLLSFKEDRIREYLNRQISTSESQVVSIATSILGFQNLTATEGKVNMYLFPQKEPNIYPLQKFLVLCTFLNSPAYRTNTFIQERCKEYIKDPFYQKWLDYQFNIR